MTPFLAAWLFSLMSAIFIKDEPPSWRALPRLGRPAVCYKASVPVLGGKVNAPGGAAEPKVEKRT